eukprot:CAMPEP_0203876952 /NCGR_PEP_ID=MMETSP0359-20131031/21634_1 /ASSEMBLY_ACC=CAM_ASM_000338 /TAXON_ID=268821 /ORGANISM="Scrippsiella Hangoei, Strain SHTV-5" /LENGTH=460 /DNA_ID=CAMNT_0050795835 /DNA_START=273 /DNA_END=1657 /DNA_ORIENTATION=-
MGRIRRNARSAENVCMGSESNIAWNAPDASMVWPDRLADFAEGARTDIEETIVRCASLVRMVSPAQCASSAVRLVHTGSEKQIARSAGRVPMARPGKIARSAAMPARQAEAALQSLLSLPTRQTEGYLQKVSTLCPWQCENRLPSVPLVPAQKAKGLVYGVLRMRPWETEGVLYPLPSMRTRELGWRLQAASGLPTREAAVLVCAMPAASAGCKGVDAQAAAPEAAAAPDVVAAPEPIAAPEPVVASAAARARKMRRRRGADTSNEFAAFFEEDVADFAAMLESETAPLPSELASPPGSGECNLPPATSASPPGELLQGVSPAAADGMPVALSPSGIPGVSSSPPGELLASVSPAAADGMPAAPSPSGTPGRQAAAPAGSPAGAPEPAARLQVGEAPTATALLAPAARRLPEVTASALHCLRHALELHRAGVLSRLELEDVKCDMFKALGVANAHSEPHA